MTVRNYRVLAAAAAAALSASAWVGAQTPSQQDIQIQDLQGKVAALEAKQASNSKDLASTIDQMIRDSEKRSQLLATNGEASAGYDNGFFIKAGDAWVLRPGAQFHFRNVTNYRETAGAGGEDSWDNGFEVRRMRFFLAGNAFSKDLDYYFEWDTNREGGSFSFLEGWARYFFADDWGMRAGQFKDLTTHEWLVGSKRQLAADVSLMDAALGGGVGNYTQGVSLIYGGARNNNNPLNVEVAYTDGANQLNTNFVGRGEPLADPEPTISSFGSPSAHIFDWGVTGRAEYKAMGSWGDYKDFTAKGTKQDLLVIGAGFDWSQGGDGDLFIGTADVAYENPNGLGLYAAAVYHYLEDRLTGVENASDWGFLVQGSYMLNGNWEVFARYDVILADNSVVYADDDEDTFHEITVGVNYYLGDNGSAGHRAKITVDLLWLPNGAPSSATGLDILDNTAGDNEVVLRAQFQLLI